MSQKQTNKAPSKLMLDRTLWLIIIFSALFMVVIGKLFHMQILNYDFYQNYAINQQTNEITIEANRGTIYDRNMKELAISASTEMVTLEPRKIGDGQHERIAEILSEILELDYEDVYEKTQRDTSYLELKKDVEKHITDEIRSYISAEGLRGVYMHSDTTRYYPYGSFASHVIGFTRSDGYGLAGIESKYENLLAGSAGKVISAQNGHSKDMPYQYETYIEAQDGMNIVLTLDEVMQHFLEKHLETALSDNEAALGVGGIIMNVNTGEVYAMATKPDFDLNDAWNIEDPEILAAIDALPEEEQKQARVDALNQIWRNKVIQDTYEPGSTFKAVTIATALEEGYVTSSDTYSCNGYHVVAGRPIRCWKSGGHGTQTLAQTLQNSCNPAMMQIAEKAGNDVFEEYVSAFGLREKTGIDLPGEALGIWFSEGNFNVLELATTSFGQGFQVTPIQMLTAVSAISNGGYLVEPTLLKQVLDQDGNVVETIEPEIKRQVISESTSEFMRETLEEVVSLGTGSNAYVAGYRVGGKTATSEKLPRGNDKYIASFIGVAPMDNPEVAVLVMIDEPIDGAQAGGGLAAAPVVGAIMEDILPYMEIDPQYTEEELATIDVLIPDMVGNTLEEANRALKSQDIDYRTVGDGDAVTDQVPKGGSVIPAGSEIILYVGGTQSGELVEVPDITDKTLSSARQTAEDTGLYLKASGVLTSKTGGEIQAVSQSPRAGELVEAGTVITARFADVNANGG